METVGGRMVLKKPPSANQSFKCPATSPRRHKKLLQSVCVSEIWKIVKIFGEEGALDYHENTTHVAHVNILALSFR